MLRYREEYYDAHKEIELEKQREKTTCECGCILAKGNMS